MHDVQRQLSVIDVGSVHSEWFVVSAGNLRGKHCRITQHHYAAFSQPKGDACARAAAEPFFPVAEFLSSAVSAISERLASRWPFERLAPKIITRLTRSVSLRPLVIGCSASSWFWRE